MLPWKRPKTPSKNELCATNESLSWLQLENSRPVWSRINKCTTAGHYRNFPDSKLNEYDIEVDNRLWSLWGTLHPEAPLFEKSIRGHQYLAINVMACCASSIFPLMDWTPKLLDSIVVCGSKYYQESVSLIDKEDYEFSLRNLCIGCELKSIKFVVHTEHVTCGRIYRVPTVDRMNLCQALIYFFNNYKYGIVMVRKRALAFGFSPGPNGGFFMFDCQSKDQPVFENEQGASYLLRTRHLQVLLYCIVVTLDISSYTDFHIYNVEMLREGAPHGRRINVDNKNLK